MKRHARLAVLGSMVLAVCLVGTLGSSRSGDASSHREAPYIISDPMVDATDLYAFVAADATDSVTFVANYVPFQEPFAGPEFYRFSDSALYEINIDNDGDAVDDVTFQFRFRNNINPANAFNVNTFLYNTGAVTDLTDADLNFRQYYSVSMLTGPGGANRTGTLIADNLQVAPARVGPKSMPDYGELANEARFTIGSGIKVFVGPRDDPFFIDVGGTFDLLNITGKDDLKGLNVLSIVIQVPKTQLTASGTAPTAIDDVDSIIGVRTTAYRRSIRILRQLGDEGETIGQAVTGDQPEGGNINRGPWVQLSRLDNALVNEVVVLTKDKDRFNGSRPPNDAQFLSYVQNSHLAALLNLVLGLTVPPNPRADLVQVFLTGIPGLNQPAGVVPSTQLRLNMFVAPSAAPNRLGVIAGDNAGYPNGRRLADDVVDISLSVVAGKLVAEAGETATADDIGDNVNANDRAFGTTGFPYLALPHDHLGTTP